MKITELFKYGPVLRAEHVLFALYRALVWPKNWGLRKNPHAVQGYERRVFSQHAEDGITVELVLRLGIHRGTFVEFGAADGGECNCAVLAKNYAWGGLMIEADPELYAKARRTYEPYPAVRIREAFVSAENIVGIVREAGLEDGFDLLCIDIDGNDYWLWKALGGFRPKMVITEFNSFFKPPTRFIKSYEPNFRWKLDWNFGASLASFEELGRELGYALVGVDGSATNAFFVRLDLLERVGFPHLTAEAAYAQSRRFRHFSRRPPAT